MKIDVHDKFRMAIPCQRGIKKCPECDLKLERDLFQLPKGEKMYGGRLIDAIACFSCHTIYDVLDD